jgi:hypothetical protein
MLTNKAGTVSQYLKQLPPDKRKALAAVRGVVLENLPKGYKESIGWGAITYEIPLADYPDTYNGQPLCVAALSAGKQHCSIHLMAAYGDPTIRRWLDGEFERAGKKLDMGKACVRFKNADDLPLPAIGTVIARITPDKYIKAYEAGRKKAASPRR